MKGAHFQLLSGSWNAADQAAGIRRYLSVLVAVVLIGAVGTLAAFDPMWSRMGLLSFLRLKIPYVHPGWLATLIVLVLGSLLVGAYAGRHWLFQHRFEICAVLIAVPGALTGLRLGPVDTYQTCLVILTFVWAARSVVERDEWRVPDHITGLMGGLAICVFASVAAGLGQTIIGFVAIFGKFLLVILTIQLINTPRLLRTALKALVVAAALSSVVALFSEGLYHFTGYELSFDDFLAFRYKDTPFGTFLRATAFFQTPQALGHMLVVALMVVLLAPWSFLVRAGLFLLLAAGLAATFSNSAYIVALIGIILAIYVRHPERFFHYTALLAGLIIILYLTGVLAMAIKYVKATGSDAAADRVEYSRVALNVIRWHPMFGIGFNNFQRALYIPVHNTYLQMAAEIGIAGGVLFTTLVLAIMIRAARAVSYARDNAERLYLKGLAVGVAVMAIQFMVEPLYTNVVSWMFLGLSAAGACIYMAHHASKGDHYVPSIVV